MTTWPNRAMTENYHEQNCQAIIEYGSQEHAHSWIRRRLNINEALSSQGRNRAQRKVLAGRSPT